MHDDERKWLQEFRRINGFDISVASLNKIPRRPPQLSNDRAQSVRRKGPHRLDNIIRGDSLALRVTNLRARAGLKPKRISRFEN